MSSIPPNDPVAFRNYLLSDREHMAAWVDQILSPDEVVAEYPFLARSVKTLATWRHLGKGPRYIVGSRDRISYRRLDILAELERRTVTPGGRS